jgi:hypothetical protein
MTEAKESRPTRRYRSAVREESARRTRQAVVAAARDLFTERGFGSKPALLRQVLDEALAGDDEPVAVADRPWFRPVREATTQQGVLDAYAEVCRLIGGRAARIFETVRKASDDAVEVGEVWEMLLRNRRIGAGTVAVRLAELGPLREGVDVDRATDIVWHFNDPAHYDSLVLRCGWDEQVFRDWLASQLKHALLVQARA